MNVRNCKKCGKLFNYISGLPICQGCKEKNEEVFQTVKKYIRENPRADIRDVSIECEVETAQIQQWIREERLEFTEDSPIKLPCEKCGALIRAGKFCEKCKGAMAKNLSSAIEKPKMVVTQAPKKEADHSSKMRFLDRR